jgi:hypothetical protein
VAARGFPVTDGDEAATLIEITDVIPADGVLEKDRLSDLAHCWNHCTLLVCADIHDSIVKGRCTL